MNKRQIATELTAAIIANNEFFTAPDTFQNNKDLLATNALSMLEVMLRKIREIELADD